MVRCPTCRSEETCVRDVRPTPDRTQLRRRRECLRCGERFTTHETPDGQADDVEALKKIRQWLKALAGKVHEIETRQRGQRGPEEG